MTPPLLSIEDLTISIQGKTLLNKINLQINKGECVGLVGESGSGKSLTAQAPLKLLDETAQQTGAIYFEQHNLLQKNEKEMQAFRGKQIGLIFQDALAGLNPTMRVGQQIAEALIHHEKIKRSAARDLAIALMEQLGIPDAETRFNAYPFQLSGGMRQRAMIGIATICRPKLLIADEATTSLDSETQNQILTLLLSLKKLYGMGILFITHEIHLLAGFCDQVSVMRHGQIVEHGPTEQVLTHPSNPYTKLLFESSCLKSL